MEALFVNGLEDWTAGLAIDFAESQVKRKGKGKGGGQFASKGGGTGGEAQAPAEAKTRKPGSMGQGRGAPGRAHSKLNRMTSSERQNAKIATYKAKQAKLKAKAAAARAKAAPAPASAPPSIPPEVVAHVEGYQKVFPQTMQRFTETMSPFGVVAGRVKTVESAAKKLSGKYAGRGVDALGDLAGFRCTSKTPADVYGSLEELKKHFRILNGADGKPDIDDKMPQGQGFYRALHVTVDSLDETGNKRAEVQLRTVRQSNIAMWGHDVAYKGRFGQDPAVQAYAKQVSDASWELDNGREASYPEPPAVLKQHGLEFQPDKEYDDFWLAREKPEFLT